MDQFCPTCADVSENLYEVLTSDLDFRTGNGKKEYVWNTDVASLFSTAAEGCTFCKLVDYVFLKPYYDPQSLGSSPWRGASTVEDLLDEEFATCITKRIEVTTCSICSGRVSWGDEGLCCKCRPRVVRYLAYHPEALSSRSPTVRISVAIRKASWALDENTDVEGVALKGHINSSSQLSLNTNEQIFRVDCLKDDPAAQYIDQRPRLSSFDDPSMFDQIRSLLDICANEHDCGPEYPADTSNWPTRLIDLGLEGTDDPVRLCNGATSEPYVALSYCWGGHQSLLTKKENIEQHLKAIPVSGLAQSVQDAMYVTRNLGIRLLWVDCLCIIQNDKSDKSREIGKMRNVYANSYLTICAGRAKAAVDGFLNPRTQPFKMDPAIVATDLTDDLSSQAAKAQSCHPKDIFGSLVISLPDGGKGNVNIRRRVEYSSAMEPLVARAWTYEERLLSKRILTFGQCVTWRCLDSHCLLADTGDHWFAPDEDYVNSVRGEPHALALQPKRLLRRWHDLVTAYSTRSMYDETDKLPAIGGIVQQIQPDNDTQAYVAGLWRNQLADDMMWCVPRQGTKPSQWRAPSWSWASLNGLVRFLDANDMVRGRDVLIKDVVYDVELDSALSPFGELKSASLYVTGRIGVADRGLIAWKSPHGSAPTAFEEVLCDSQDPSTVTYEGTSRLKIDLEEDSLRRREDEESEYAFGNAMLLRSERVWCLPLHGCIDFAPDDSWADDRYETRTDGLLLLKTDESSYRRIGVFEVAKYDDGRYFRWSEPGRIHLI